MWAVFYTILGSVFSSLALILMKKSHNRAELDYSNNIKRNSYCNPLWLFGFAILILGSILNIIALGYGNVLLLASSSSLSIIFNTGLSVTLLNEKLLKKDILAMTFICIGSILFLTVAKNDPEEYTVSTLMDLYIRPISIVYMIL
jgi:drug/metabolite transporter (DMT)-like permease